MSASDEKSLSALLDEHREFPPSEEFRRQANASDPAIYERAKNDPQAFWASEAKRLDWFTPWQQGARMEGALGEVVRRRQAERRLQLRRSPRRSPPAATRPPSSGKASRAIRAC